MARTLWEVFLSVFTRDDRDTEATEEDDDRFVPSPLDLSVRSSHGGPDAEIERELGKINEQAREIEENRREE